MGKLPHPTTLRGIAMNVFTDDDLAEIQAFIDVQLKRLAAIGLHLEPDVDMQAYARFLGNVPLALPVPSTHDPERSYLHPGNAYWTKLVDEDGNIVGCNGQRMHETGNLFEDIRTHAFFKDRLPLIHHYPLAFYEDLEFPKLSGRISIGGGMWIHPDWRGGHNALGGSKIYGVYSPLVRAIALRHFKLDWYCAMYSIRPSRTALGQTGAGFSNTVNLLKGLFPVQDREANIQFMWMSRVEMLQFIRERIIGSRTKRQA